MTVLTTTFDCNGEEVPVSSVQQPGESDADFLKRHRQAVADAKRACGKVASAT